MGGKAGDNTQVLALAEALGWPFETKTITYRSYELVTNLLLGGNLAGIVKRDSSPLTPPWPDLVISAGRRNEPVARWIQGRAGKPVRLVHFGRPWASPRCFDLIITTPQYGIPDDDNVLRNTLPLHRVTREQLDQAARHWSSRLGHLQPPYVAVLAGGHSGGFSFTAEKARSFMSRAGDLAKAMHGSLLVTTSARTPAAAVAAMKSAIDLPAYFFEWPGAGADNPYLGYLALADAFVITGDSISMLTEACATGKPVYISSVSPGRAGGAGRPEWRPKALLSRCAAALAPRRMTRDIGVIHRQLIEAGNAAWLGQTFADHSTIRATQDLDRAVARVRQLFAHTGRI